MATIKVACPKCGQKVSGDETFFGTVVDCPICTSAIKFPGEAKSQPADLPMGKPISSDPAPTPRAEDPVPVPAASPEAPPQAEFSHLPPPPGESGPVLPAESDYPPAGRERRSSSTRHRASEADGDWDDYEDEVPSPLFGALSLVCGILGVVTCGILGPLSGPLAVIFGHIGLARARTSPVQPAPGGSTSVVGLILGYLTLLVVIVLLVSIIFFGDQIQGMYRQMEETP